MRYVITGEWSNNSLLRLIVAMFLVYIFLFWITNGMLYFERMDLRPQSVVAYFLGDAEEEFGRPPRPYGALVETSHVHLFAMGMLVMVLTHLLLFVPVPLRTKGTLVAVTFASSLVDELSSWMVRFVDAGFAYVKVVSFVVMQASLLALIVVLAWYLWDPRRNAYRDSTIVSREETPDG